MGPTQIQTKFLLNLKIANLLSLASGDRSEEGRRHSGTVVVVVGVGYRGRVGDQRDGWLDRCGGGSNARR